ERRARRRRPRGRSRPACVSRCASIPPLRAPSLPEITTAAQNLTAQGCYGNRSRPMLLGWAHPAAAAATILLAARGASLGLRGRPGHPRAERHRARHTALMPWVYGLVVASWAGGLASVWTLRDDLTPAASGHFAVGTAIVVLFTAAARVRFTRGSARPRCSSAAYRCSSASRSCRTSHSGRDGTCSRTRGSRAA